MRKHDLALAERLSNALSTFGVSPMPGIALATSRLCLLEQLVESHRRIKYISVLCTRGGSVHNTDPRHMGFDPLRAAIYHKKQAKVEEAFWMVFLSVYFGKHRADEWRLLANIYADGHGDSVWSWTKILNEGPRFREFIENYVRERDQGRVQKFRFGNHRKYETLNPNSARGLNSAVDSYVEWVGRNAGHGSLASRYGNIASEQRFDMLYTSMDRVVSFGRTARFDYLTMIGKLGLLDIVPGHPFLCGSTGPVRGARLLFGVNDITQLESLSTALGVHLGLHMQAIEDSLCNWQKSPNRFVAFRG